MADPKLYRFGSFAPVRDGGSQVKWLVDGQDYMSAVADAVVAAKYELLITDWQLNPHVHMKRPDTGVTSLEWRLDKMLLKKAEEGVRVYILLYWETKVNEEMDRGSDFTLSVLKHENIEIHRHPTYATPILNPTTFLRWSHHEKLVVVDRSIAFVGGIDLCFGRWDTHDHELTDQFPHHPCTLEKDEPKETNLEESPKKYCRWVGKDYGNIFFPDVKDHGNILFPVVSAGLDRPLDDYLCIDEKDKEKKKIAIRQKHPRMPWHDVSCVFNGDPALDVTKHFIQRYKAILRDGRQHSIENWDHPEVHHCIPDPSASNVKIQVLRSVDKWSANQPHEDSIYKAYLHAIKNAEHFIYIENQFFISSQPKECFRKVQNGIQSALCDRIARAYGDRKDFHVIIFLPLKPAFSGEWGTKDGKNLEAVSYWNYATLYNGDHSLFNRLKQKNIPAASYVSVYGLRTHSTLGDEFVSEIIYVHSKLMIVDDRFAIIGSANINDRSMLGERDSEVDVIIEDKDLLDGEMNGKSYCVGKFSHGLRCCLVKEHLGLSDNGHQNQKTSLTVEDPLIYSFLKGVSHIATSNTRIYEQVFQGKILPTNEVQNKTDLENWKTCEGLADIFPEGAKEELSKIRGRVVNFPCFFLCENLQSSFFLDCMGMYAASGLFHISACPPREHQQQHSCARVSHGTLFKELFSLASKWDNIGIMLDIPYGDLDDIRRSNSNQHRVCLREMIRVWQEMTDPEPTWERLVEAVEMFDAKRAEEIKSKYIPKT